MATDRTLLHRFRRPVFVWAVTALGCELVAERLIGPGSAWPPAVQTLVAIAPLVPSLAFMLALVRMVQNMDELQRRICLDSVFIAFIATLSLAFVLSSFEQAGLYRGHFDSIGTIMLMIWACAYLYMSSKYR